MKALAVLLVACLLMASVPAGISASITPVTVLASVEEVLYGAAKTGALLERIDSIEMDIYGSVQDGAVMLRIDRVQQFVETNKQGSGSLKLQLNLAEWGFSGTLRTADPLVQRLSTLETDLLGSTQSGPLVERTRNLMEMIWGTTELDIQGVELSEASLVKIRTLSEVDSGTMEEGDPVRYRVVEDVLVDGRVVIPSGAEAVGRVAEVQSAGRIGRDGRVVIDFESVSALDGTMVPLKVDERATEKNHSLEIAAGASMAGILLLGPIGLVGGYFVRGQDIKIPVGTEFYVETARGRRLTGFLLRPGAR